MLLSLVKRLSFSEKTDKKENRIARVLNPIFGLKSIPLGMVLGEGKRMTSLVNWEGMICLD